MRRVASIFFCVTILLAVDRARAHEVDLSNLPLRDGAVSSRPQVGSVFACQRRFRSDAPGAQRGGNWLSTADNTFDLTTKPTVDGSVRHLSELEVAILGARRVVTGNALPDHPTGRFPVSRSDDAYFYDRNPNAIRVHDFEMVLPLNPTLAENAQCVPMGAIGIMLTGAVLFNALDARGENALAHEILDACQGHPQQSGLYHYHGRSPCQPDGGDPGEHSGLVGYAFDGFGIYGYRGEDGHLLKSSELDACHGHVGAVMWDGEKQTMYHYHATPDYPYTVSCFRGRPVRVSGLTAGQQRSGPPPRRGPRPGPRPHWR